MIALALRFWPYLLGGLAVIGAYLWIDHRGYQRGVEHTNAIYAKAAGRALKAMQAGARRIDSLNGLSATAQAAQDTENRNIRNAAAPIIVRPIYARSCVDADGVGLLDRARANSNRTLDSGQPAGRTR